MPANGRWDLIRRLKVNALSCSRVLLEKPTGPQTVKTLPAILEPNIHYGIDNCPPCCLNPVHASSYILILFYHQRLGIPSVHFLSGVHIKTLHELLSTIRIIWPANLIIFDLLTPLIFPEEYTHAFQCCTCRCTVLCYTLLPLYSGMLTWTGGLYFVYFQSCKLHPAKWQKKIISWLKIM